MATERAISTVSNGLVLMRGANTRPLQETRETMRYRGNSGKQPDLLFYSIDQLRKSPVHASIIANKTPMRFPEGA